MKIISLNFQRNGLASNGFTLIEVVVATFVVAIALVALANTVQAVTREQSDLNTKFFANLVASNKMAELQSLPQWPELGESDEDVEMADKEWFIEMEVTETAVDSLRRVDLKIGLNNENKNTETFLSGFLGQTPQIGGETVAWTQLDPIRSGNTAEDRNDNTEGEEPNDPNPNEPIPVPTPLNPDGG